MATEKETEVNIANQNVVLQDDSSDIQTKGQTSAEAAFGEAVGVYGNVATAEELGYVQRGYVSCMLRKYYSHR